MAYRNQHKPRATILQKIGFFAITLSIVCGVVYAPLNTPRAQAFLGIGDIVIDVKRLAERIIDGVAIATAQTMVDELVRSSIEWANTGFEGNPAYVTDFEGFLSDVASITVNEFIEDRELEFLCSPFQDSVRLSLRAHYNPTAEKRYQCTWDEAWGNIEDFSRDFDQGGWDAWFAISQNPTNNPHGAYLTARVDLDSRIASALNIETTRLEWNQGFRDWAPCIEADPDTGKCLKRDESRTPGAIIHGQIEETLGTTAGRLVSVQHVEQLISSFAAGLLQRHVFGPRGLFADSSGTYNSGITEQIDIDEDGLPDGIDNDGDERLDTCFHGRVNENQPPSNSNCISSSETRTSPYFIPLCQGLSNSIGTLENYRSFLTTNTFDSAYINTWTRRSMNVSGAVDSLVSSLERYELREFDKVASEVDKYLKFLDERISRLARGQNLYSGLRNIRLETAIALGISANSVTPDDMNDVTRQKLLSNTVSLLNYLRNIDASKGRCDAPDTDAIDRVQGPTLDTPGDEEDEAGGDSGGDTASTTPEEI